MSHTPSDGTERHGNGIFECPRDSCHVTILGAYGDLLHHVREEHPLLRVRADSDGKTVLDRIKQAQKDALKQDIHEQMVVTGTNREGGDA